VLGSRLSLVSVFRCFSIPNEAPGPDGIPAEV